MNEVEARELQIIGRLKQLNRTIEEIERTSTSLASRLIPILRPDAPPAKNELKNPMEEQAPLALEIAEIGKTALNIFTVLDNVLNRLEV